MIWKNTSQRYGIITIALHWSIALLIISLIGLGWYITTITYYHPYYHQLFTLHKSLGLLAFALAFMNTLWYLLSVKPSYPPTIKPFEIFAAKCAHLLLLAFMLSVPVSGYFISTATGDGVSFFDWFTVPGKSHRYAQQAGLAHAWLAYGMAAIICIHILAALKHEFIHKDGILRRMLGLKTS